MGTFILVLREFNVPNVKDSSKAGEYMVLKLHVLACTYVQCVCVCIYVHSVCVQCVCAVCVCSVCACVCAVCVHVCVHV